MNRITIASTAGLLVATTAASAGITTYVSTGSMLVNVTNSANFNALTPGQSLMGYEENGLRLSVNRTYFSWDPPGLDGSEMFYSNTGALELVDITLSSGDDFQDVDMQIASGWSPNEIGDVYIWAQLYDDGSLVGEFNIDLLAGSYLGFMGGGFDQILIGSYVTADIRDARNPSERNAIAIDNLSVGTFVPAPASSMFIAIGVLAGVRRKR
jgi:hypothetical protein